MVVDPHDGRTFVGPPATDSPAAVPDRPARCDLDGEDDQLYSLPDASHPAELLLHQATALLLHHRATLDQLLQRDCDDPLEASHSPPVEGHPMVATRSSPHHGSPGHHPPSLPAPGVHQPAPSGSDDARPTSDTTSNRKCALAQVMLPARVPPHVVLHGGTLPVLLHAALARERVGAARVLVRLRR